MLKSLVTRVKNAAVAFLDEEESVVPGWSEAQKPEAHGYVVSSEEKAFIQQFSTESEVEQLQRRCTEYFSLIERIEIERNQWVEMWREQAGAHMEAQALLERQLVEVRKIAVRAIRMLNEMRKEKDLEPIEVRVADDLEPYDAEPVGFAEEYAKRLIALRAMLEAPLDAVFERDVIDSKYSDSQKK